MTALATTGRHEEDYGGVCGSAAGEPANVLVVDDDEQILRLLRRVLERAAYRCFVACDAAEARRVLKTHRVELVLCDVSMPGESGIELVSTLPLPPPVTAVVMISAHDDARTVRSSLDCGAYGYVTKPFKPNDVLIGVASALRRRQLELQSQKRSTRLQCLARTQEAALATSAAQLRASRHEVIRRLSIAVESRDGETAAHVERMSRYAALLSRPFGLDPEAIRLASSLHDVGKVAISDGILLKPGPLTQAERRAMQHHTDVGYRILTGSDSALLELAASIAWTHHERLDGTGYPRGLSGSEIPLPGRIAAVADVFDALTSDRPYRSALPVEDSLTIMSNERGRHFDPAVVDELFERLDEVLELRKRWTDNTGQVPGN